MYICLINNLITTANIFDFFYYFELYYLFVSEEICSCNSFLFVICIDFFADFYSICNKTCLSVDYLTCVEQQPFKQPALCGAHHQFFVVCACISCHTSHLPNLPSNTFQEVRSARIEFYAICPHSKFNDILTLATFAGLGKYNNVLSRFEHPYF